MDNDSALSTQREKYLQQQLRDLILLQNNDVLDRRKLAAAVLYEQAHLFSATSYERDLVQDVTWMLGLRWLLGIVVGGDNSDEMPPLPIKNEYVGEIFNKRRRLQPSSCNHSSLVPKIVETRREDTSGRYETEISSLAFYFLNFYIRSLPYMSLLAKCRN